MSEDLSAMIERAKAMDLSEPEKQVPGISVFRDLIVKFAQQQKKILDYIRTEHQEFEGHRWVRADILLEMLGRDEDQ